MHLLAAVFAVAALAAPHATIGYAPSHPVASQPVTLSAAGSTCGSRTPCAFKWYNNTRYLGSGKSLKVTFPATTVSLKLKVYDKRGTLKAQAAKRLVVTKYVPPVTTDPDPTTTTPAPPTDTTTTPAPPTDTTTTPAPPTDTNPTPPASTCDRTAAPSTLASQFSAASAGQVICLAPGSYGTWTGGNKAVTLKANGAVTLGVDFTTGDASFTLDGLTIPGGSITNGARDITIRNAKFTDALKIDGVANANILIDHSTFNNINTCSACTPARLALPYGSSTFSGVTVSNSTFIGGNADGIQSGTGLNIINNEFADIRETGPNDSAHSDPIQLIGARGAVVRGNYVHDSADGIVAYDGLDHATIENNVVNLVSGRWGIELYSDNGSIVRHNTLVYGTGCEYAACGWIILDRKATNPAGVGTIIQDNIATTIATSNGSQAAVEDHNMVRNGALATDFTGVPVFAPGSFELATGSPGRNAASDDTDVGA